MVIFNSYFDITRGYHRNHCDPIPFTISFFLVAEQKILGFQTFLTSAWRFMAFASTTWRSPWRVEKLRFCKACGWKAMDFTDFTISFWKVSMICNGKSLHPIFCGLCSIWTSSMMFCLTVQRDVFRLLLVGWPFQGSKWLQKGWNGKFEQLGVQSTLDMGQTPEPIKYPQMLMLHDLNISKMWLIHTCHWYGCPKIWHHMAPKKVGWSSPMIQNNTTCKFRVFFYPFLEIQSFLLLENHLYIPLYLCSMDVPCSLNFQVSDLLPWACSNPRWCSDPRYSPLIESNCNIYIYVYV